MSSFSEKILVSKLRGLNETQASIVGLSQWILFHHRQSKRIAITWRDTLNNAPVEKKLPLIYLANDVIQQARARRKTEFLDDFGKIISSALINAYKAIPNETIRLKIKRSVNVWQERHILSSSLLQKILDNFSEIDNNKQVNDYGVASQASFAIPELKALNEKYTQLNRSTEKITQSLLQFSTEYDKLFGDDSNLQSPNIFLNQIQNLLKIYYGVKLTFEKRTKVKKNIVNDLEKLLHKTTSDKLETFELFASFNSLNNKLDKMLKTKEELEEMILGEGNLDKANSSTYNPVDFQSTNGVNEERHPDDNTLNNDDEYIIPKYEDDDDDEDIVPQYEDSDSEKENENDNENKHSYNNKSINNIDNDNDNDNDKYPKRPTDSRGDQPDSKKQKTEHSNESSATPQTSSAISDASKLLEALKQLPR